MDFTDTRNMRLQPVIFDSDIEILHMPQSSHSKRDFSIFKKSINNGTHLENYVLRMFCKELLISGSDDDFEEFYDIFTRRLIYEYTDNDCLEAISCVLARMYRLKNLSDDFLRLHLKMLLYHHVLKSVWKLAIIFSIKTTYLRLSYGISMPAVKQRAFLT